MRQMIPFFSSSRPNSIAFQLEDAFPVKTVSTSRPFGKYFALRTWAHKLSGFSINLHACFDNRARLKSCKSRKPIPPLSLGTHIFHQANQCILRCFSSSPHQYCDIASVIPLQIFLGNLNTLIAYHRDGMGHCFY